jgi:hypothetical protein
VSAAKPKQGEAEDVLLFHSPTEDGKGLRAIRKRNEQVELCSVRAARDGEPLHGELATLRQRSGAPHLYDVEVHYAPPGAGPPRTEDPASTPPATDRQTTGPAQVASPTYRKGWDRIWGSKPKRSLPS